MEVKNTWLLLILQNKEGGGDLMIYILVLIGVVVSGGMINKRFITSRKRNNTVLKSATNGAMVYMVIWGNVLIAMVGLRAISIGRDTSMYSYVFHVAEMSSSYDDFLSRYGYSYFEYFYFFLNYLVSRVGNYQLFLVVMAASSIVPVMVVVYRYSDNKIISIILYICFPYFTFCMSGMRQAAAIGCIMIAYCFMREKKLLQYITSCLFGIFFHSSALIFFPAYWINKLPNKKYMRVVFIVAMVAAYFFRQPLLQIALLFSRQDYSGSSEYSGGQMMYLFMILSVILGFFYNKKFKEYDEGSHKELLYFQILSVIIWPIASVNPALFRMYYYYHIFVILYVPSLIKSISRKTEGLVVTGGYLFVSLYFLFTQTLSPAQKFYPYMFFWE